MTAPDIHPFRIEIPQAQLDDLDTRLASTADGAGRWAAGHCDGTPTAVLVSAQDVTIRRWAERDHNVVRWTELDSGGHFLSLERPDELVADVREFFAAVR